MAGRYVTCSTCGTTSLGCGPLNPSCFKCRSSMHANNWNAGSGNGRSGDLGWSSRSSSGREQPEDSADGRTWDTENRSGDLGWRSRSSNSGELMRGLPAGGRASDSENRSGELGWRGRRGNSGEQGGLPAGGIASDTERSGELGWRGRSSNSGELRGLPAGGRASGMENRSGEVGWRGRSTNSGELRGFPAGGRMSDTENRSGGLGWRGRSAYAGGSDGDDGSKFRSSPNDLSLMVVKSLNLGTDDSETSGMLRKPRGTLFSDSQSFVSSEDTFDGEESSWNGDCPGSPHSADGRAYEPSVSSEEGYTTGGVSRRTRKFPRPAQDGKQVGKSQFGNGDMAADSGELPRGRFLPPGPRGERFVSDTSGSLGGSSDSRSQGREPSSSGSGELSGFNWPGMGNGDPLGQASPSGELGRPGGLRGNQYRNNSNQPPMRSRHPDAENSGQMSLDGLREVNPYGPKSAEAASPSQAPSAGTGIPPPPSHSRPSSSASRSIHCCAHCRSEACRAFEHFPVGVCCSNGACSTCSHTCCQPLGSNASGQTCHGKPNPFIPRANSAQQPDGLAPKAKEKKKHYCRPVFGGANFISCYQCDELLQMPEDFHFSRTRRNKLRCGNCAEVIVYVLIDKTRIVPHHVAVNLKIQSSTAGVPGGRGGSRDAAPRSSAGGLDGSNRSSRSQAAASSGGDGSNHSRGEQISCYDNYSGYSDGGGSTEGEADSQSRNALRKKRAAALHRLMGYFSARDIMYQAP